MAQQRDNSGTLSRNKDKEKEDANPNWPDFKGRIRVAGVDYWLNGWVKETDSGKFFSLSVQPQQGGQQQGKPKHSAIDGMDDDIPFSNPYRGTRCYVV